MPRDFKAVIASLAPGLGVSSNPSIPMTLLLTDTSAVVFPSPAVFQLVGSKTKGLCFGLE